MVFPMRRRRLRATSNSDTQIASTRGASGLFWRPSVVSNNMGTDSSDLAYIAGYLDGEGCFSVGRHWKISIICENTHRPTIEWLHSIFNGSFSARIFKRKPQWRPTYRWQVVGNDALSVCQIIAPYLREKTEQALLLIAIQLRKQSGSIRRRIANDEATERDRLAALVKGLKHVAT